MQSDPKGPVYLSFPRETPAETGDKRGALVSGGALRPGGRGRRRSRRDRGACRAAARGGTSGADHLLWRAQPRDRRAARRTGALRRHPRVRIQSAAPQPAARFALLRRLHAGEALRSRCRRARRCRRAVDSEGHAGQPDDLVGAHRRGCREARLPDVGTFPATCAWKATAISSSLRAARRAAGARRPGSRRARPSGSRLAEQGSARREQAAWPPPPGSVGQINLQHLCAALPWRSRRRTSC